MGEGAFVLRAQVLPLLGKFFKPYRCSHSKGSVIPMTNVCSYL